MHTGGAEAVRRSADRYLSYALEDALEDAQEDRSG